MSTTNERIFWWEGPHWIPGTAQVRKERSVKACPICNKKITEGEIGDYCAGPMIRHAKESHGIELEYSSRLGAWCGEYLKSVASV